MDFALIALFLGVAALATVAQTLTGFAFALVLVGLGGILQLAPVANLPGWPPSGSRSKLTAG